MNDSLTTDQIILKEAKKRKWGDRIFILAVLVVPLCHWLFFTGYVNVTMFFYSFTKTKLNGDILIYDNVLDTAVEISSMGVRVDEESLVKQLKKKKELDKLSNAYCRGIIDKKLPLTIGGGIGQSRVCMLLLKKKHIGEVQASVWSEKTIEDLKKEGITLL